MAVWVAVLVNVAEGGTAVFVGVGVLVCVAVAVKVGVRVGVRVAEGVNVGVGVFVGVPEPTMYWITSFGRCVARLASDV